MATDGTTAQGTASPQVASWLAELNSAQKRVKDYRKQARETVRLYEAVKGAESPFNILYSNTDTLLPALYSNTPVPVVKRRYNDEDPLAKLASDIIRRSLSFFIDNESGDYAPFDSLIEQAVLEALVPGIGVTWFKYDAGASAEGSEYETVCGEAVPWDRFLHGYAKQWKGVPWIAREHFMTREELVDNFGSELGRRVALTVSGKASSQSDFDSDSGEAGADKIPDAEGVDLAHVYEIWSKTDRRVYFLAPAYPQDFLREVEDPLELTGFYPIPEPLMLFRKISSLVPVTLYSLYEEQAKELNQVTVRIKRLIQVLKVRGMYDATLEGLESVFNAEDNTLIPAVNVAAMQQGQTLEKAIWLVPIEKIITVLQQLYLQRQQIKQVIYEITGISDIVRGSTAASETATAQSLKSQWGTLRLKRMQKRVARYVRDSLRIVGEISMSKLSQQTISELTGVQLPTQEQKQRAQALWHQAQVMGRAQPGSPPPPELGAILSKPSWDEVLQLLTSDLLRNYRINVQTNSTLALEASSDKEDMTEFMNAMAQFLNGVAPLVTNGTLPFDAAKAMLLTITRRLAFGPELEDELMKMQAPQPPQESDNVQATAKLELEVAQVQHKLKLEQMAMEQQVKTTEATMKVQEMQRKAELAVAQHTLKMRELAAKAQTGEGQNAAV